MTGLSSKVVTVAPTLSLDETVRELAARSQDVKFPGVAVVLDSDGIILGTLTDGDIRRAYARDLDFSTAVREVMIDDPITVGDTLPLDEVALRVYQLARTTERLKVDAVRQVLVADSENRLVDVYDFNELRYGLPLAPRTIAVIGMGFVGLTLAATLANLGHLVTGVDIDKSTVQNLSDGKVHVHEPGLEDLLVVNQRRGAIRFATQLGSDHHSVLIIAVGTPIGANGNPDLAHLSAACATVGRTIAKNDMVIVRSTVPVGCTRETCLPILEHESGLTAGQDFSLAFAPERTIEGAALRELRELPQVVGGLTARCGHTVSEFWSSVCPSVTQVDSLEAAEIVKLANNTFRDLSFAFANEIASMCEIFNINAPELIDAANKGYPRNKMSAPSPGVGGYCLTKDSLLYDASIRNHLGRPSLGWHARTTNNEAGRYPLILVEGFAKLVGKSIDALNILIVGVAFKGDPETADLRGSVAVEIGHALREHGAHVFAWDAVVTPAAISGEGFTPVENLGDGVAKSDAVLIMNNHKANIQPRVYVGDGRRRLVFDGWAMLDQREVAREPGLEYATMGFCSFDI